MQTETYHTMQLDCGHSHKVKGDAAPIVAAIHAERLVYCPACYSLRLPVRLFLVEITTTPVASK
jgi:hypothetical protein